MLSEGKPSAAKVEATVWTRWSPGCARSLSEEALTRRHQTLTSKRQRASPAGKWHSSCLGRHAPALLRGVKESPVVDTLFPPSTDIVNSFWMQETLEDIDKNGDGHVDADEYIGELRWFLGISAPIKEMRHK